MFDEAKIDYISENPSIAKEVVTGMGRYIDRLLKKLAVLTGTDVVTLDMEVVEKFLTEQQKESLRRKQFGSNSEKRGNKEKNESDKKKKKPATSGKQPINPQWPRQQELFTLDEGSPCGCEASNELKPIVGQFEVSEEVDFIPGTIVVKQIKRQKYSAPCGCITTAPGPTKLVDGGQYSIPFAAEVVVRKYVDHLPLERISNMFGRDGFHLSPTTLWNQTRHVANLLDGVYDAILEVIRASHLKQADETGWLIIEELTTKRQYMWLFRCPDYVYYTIRATRGSIVPREVLGDDCKGVLVTDDYKGYHPLIEKSGIEWAKCWAHARRKFIDLEADFPEISEFLDLVTNLYIMDRIFRQEGPQTSERRQDLCGPIIEAIDIWRKKRVVLPRSAFGKALNYLANNWEGLSVFLHDPSVPLDNNASERDARTPVLGRKNFLFNRSHDGARVTSILYTICRSCLLNGVNPRRYIVDMIDSIRNCLGFQLPHIYKMTHREEIDTAR